MFVEIAWMIYEQYVVPFQKHHHSKIWGTHSSWIENKVCCSRNKWNNDWVQRRFWHKYNLRWSEVDLVSLALWSPVPLCSILTEPRAAWAAYRCSILMDTGLAFISTGRLLVKNNVSSWSESQTIPKNARQMGKQICFLHQPRWNKQICERLHWSLLRSTRNRR